MLRFRLPRPLLRRALLRPEPLFALLILLVSVVYFLLSGREGGTPLPQIEISQPEERVLETQEVKLVRYDESGLENPTFASVALPEAPGDRLEAILAALRESTRGSYWPEEVPVPNVFVETVGRQSVAVLDFRPEEPVSLTVAQEMRLFRSVEATVLANGADTIRYLLRGEAAGVFLEHLAVPAAL